MTRSILLFWAVSITTMLCRGQDIRSVTCPGHVQGEAGAALLVQCIITGDIDLVYWYKGTPTDKDLPILSLEDGQFGGSEHEKGGYELTADGAMSINNVQLGNQDTYTIKVYFIDDGTPSTSSVVISVYIRPPQSCPYIDSCSHTCEQCNLKRDSDGVLTCFTNGARPKLNIAWEIIRQDSLNFVESQPVYTKWGERWNSSISITYKPAKCGAHAVLRCFALNSHYLLKNATVFIDSESCRPMSSKPIPTQTMSPAKRADERRTPSIALIMTILFVTGLVVIGLLLVFFRYRKTKDKQPKDVQRKILIRKLVSSYMKEVCTEPADSTADIKRTYRNAQCTYTNRDGTPSVRTIEDLYRSRFRKANDRVLIVAARGFGKQTTTKKLLVNWSKSRHDYLLLYIPIMKLKQGSTLPEIVKELYVSSSELTVEGIDDLCKSNECLVLLGDLEYLQSEGSVSRPTESDNMMSSSLSISHLLEGNIEDIYKPMQVWVTSRDDDNLNSRFKEPYMRVRIEGIFDTPV